MPIASSRTFILMSAATWSLRERAVCMRPPAAPPASATTSDSTSSWMSSDSPPPLPARAL